MQNLPSDRYKESNTFTRFLQCTDEKTVLGYALTSLLGKHKVNHLLDIGDGNGSLTKILSKHAERTTIIEPSARLAQQAMQQGIKNLTVHIAHLEEIDHTPPADITLISHTLPFFHSWKEAIQKAISLTKDRLILILKTAVGCDD